MKPARMLAFRVVALEPGQDDGRAVEVLQEGLSGHLVLLDARHRVPHIDVGSHEADDEEDDDGKDDPRHGNRDEHLHEREAVVPRVAAPPPTGSLRTTPSDSQNGVHPTCTARAAVLIADPVHGCDIAEEDSQ